ncbi:hypothetical protein TpMuguga_03g00081 [Theileria parva strain Muguga]|uniref:Uncharacterized protein n=1 Tax=Theileria parva TaxID=5875 RepID=Q4N0N5_THEPA|nr:uncharacterized protein TpMuguga_03g00081 [Theileria parva strain Muguga]EAN30817.1 hypothetical protein TpMuguga_03g00081 [Theileria parva strain Muguga]|eukprot:XP_763100.1 hypothetical protein [Theileria parva strain Muguga]
MDDMAEYRRRHREAYLKRVGLDSQQSSDKSTSSKHNINNPGNNINNNAENNNKFLSNNINDQKYMDELDANDLFRDDLDRVSGLDEVDGIMGKRERDAELMDDEASLELAKKLQREFDSMEEVRKPDDSYKECLLSGPSDPINVIDENADMDLQRAIAKSLIDM